MKRSVILVLIAVGGTLLYTRLQPKPYAPRYVSISFTEWLDNKLQPGNTFVKSLTVTEIIEGTVESVGYKKGRIGGLKYYYTGSPGYYTYDSYVSIMHEGKIVPIFFSPERTRKMKVFRDGQQIPFDSIKQSEFIRLTEVLDIAKDNRDDANLIEIRIDIEP